MLSESERRIDETFVGEQRHPRVGADEVVDEERDHQQRDQDVLLRAPVAGDVIGDRITQGEAQHDCREREADGSQEHRDVERVEGVRVVVQLEGVDRSAEIVGEPERQRQDQRERDCEEKDEPEPARHEEA